MLNEDEKKFVYLLVKNELESFEKEGDTVLRLDFPQFFAIEENYEGFVKSLLKKIKEWK